MNETYDAAVTAKVARVTMGMGKAEAEVLIVAGMTLMSLTDGRIFFIYPKGTLLSVNLTILAVGNTLSSRLQLGGGGWKGTIMCR